MAAIPEHILKYSEIITCIAYHHMMFAIVVLVVMCLSYKRKAKILILDFSCYRPPSCQRMPHARFAEHTLLDGRVTPESAAFQIKILEKSGFSEETCASPPQCTLPVIYAIEKNLRLNEENVKASKMTLYRFGNTSSSSIWYKLCYIKAKGKMKKGNTIWQIAFGSGFKCSSAVLKCLSANEKHKTANAWTDCIDSYPVNIPDEVKIR